MKNFSLNSLLFIILFIGVFFEATEGGGRILTRREREEIKCELCFLVIDALEKKIEKIPQTRIGREVDIMKIFEGICEFNTFGGISLSPRTAQPLCEQLVPIIDEEVETGFAQGKTAKELYPACYDNFCGGYFEWPVPKADDEEDYEEDYEEEL